MRYKMINNYNELELIPNQKSKARPAFTSQEEYEKFRREFAEAVRPQIESYN